MSESAPRLRMFAGPNGSGKTTVKRRLQWPDEWFGAYVNPDDIEAAISATGRFALDPLGLATSREEVEEFFASSALLRKHGLHEVGRSLACSQYEIDFRSIKFNSYYASVLSDFLRRKLIRARRSFTFETVMSFRDKVDLLGEAQSQGFRTYLYYVATEDPRVNVRRVRNRVADGGHDVPVEKIVDRYHRSLALLREAIRYTNRAYLFDTSDDLVPWFFAEITDGKQVELKSDEMPAWFAPIWSGFAPHPSAE